MAESAERESRGWEIRDLVPSRVKPMTYKIDTCRFLARHSTLLAYGKDKLAQSQGYQVMMMAASFPSGTAL